MNMLYMQADVEQDFLLFLTETMKRESPLIERVYNISVDVFKHDYARKSKPVILSGSIDGWQDKREYSLDYFATSCLNANAYLNSSDIQRLERLTVAEIVNRVRHASQETPICLQEWWFQNDCKELLEDISKINYFDDDWGARILGFMNHTLWISSKGWVTPLHVDSLDFNLISSQLFGSKEWFLFGKDACLYADGDGKPDYHRFLTDPMTKPMHGVLLEGEVLYMPYQWWHRTVSLEHAASVSSMYITEDIIKSYVSGLFTLPILFSMRQQEIKHESDTRYQYLLERIKDLGDSIGFDSDYAFRSITNC